MSWEDAFDHPLLGNKVERSPSPCYSSRSAISSKNIDMDIFKKANEIKQKRLKLN
jgi:hypothetical protein